MSTFRIRGLDPERFEHLFGASDAELAAQGARRCVADASSGYPDRIEMRDLEPGETAILVNYTHLDADSPYRSSHAVFVREGANQAYDRVDEVPAVLGRRLLSVRAFDQDALMTRADVVEGAHLHDWLASAFADRSIDFVDVHYAKAGCFAARARRA